MMSRRLVLPLVLLAACEATPPASDAQPLPPPGVLTLTLLGEATVGRTWGWEVTGADAGAPITLYASNGGASPDAGPCPSGAGGRCLDSAGGALGHQVIATGSADGAGVWRSTAPFPRAVGVGTYQIQALVAAGAASAESGVADVTVTRGCRTDTTEPDDSMATASTLATSLQGAVVCTTDPDWYRVSVPPDGFVELTITHASDSDGDLDVELLDADGFPLAESMTAWDEEIVRWYNFGAAPVDTFLHIWAFADRHNNGVGYAIRKEVVQAGVCTADAFEPDDDAAQARPAGTGTYAGRACEGDGDWFAFDVSAGEVVSATIAHVPADGLVGVALLDASGARVSGPPQDTVNYLSATTQRMYAEVVLESDTGLRDGNDYVLDLRIADPGVCTEDGWEQDDDPTQARFVGTGRHERRACIGDGDWFAIPVAAGQTLDLGVDEDAGGGDVEMHVYDPSRQRMTTRPVDRYTVTATTGGTWYVEGLLVADDALGGGNDYALVAALFAHGACPTDAYEPNDSASQAAPIAPGLHLNLGACRGADPDWYRFDAAAGQDITVALAFLNADADVDTELVGPNGSVLSGSYSVDDAELLTATAPSTGTYQVRVYLYADYGGPTLDGARYSMDLSVQ